MYFLLEYFQGCIKFPIPGGGSLLILLGKNIKFERGEGHIKAVAKNIKGNGKRIQCCCCLGSVYSIVAV